MVNKILYCYHDPYTSPFHGTGVTRDKEDDMDNGAQTLAPQSDPLPELLEHILEVVTDAGTADVIVRGRLLGTATTAQENHENHEGEWATVTATGSKAKCSKCRWTEVYIYNTEGVPGEYKFLVLTIGRSDVPGEVDLVRRSKARNALSVSEALVMRNNVTGHTHRTHCGARALAEAASYDASLRDEFNASWR